MRLRSGIDNTTQNQCHRFFLAMTPQTFCLTILLQTSFHLVCKAKKCSLEDKQ
jgi:hypothetical protein